MKIVRKLVKALELCKLASDSVKVHKVSNLRKILDFGYIAALKNEVTNLFDELAISFMKLFEGHLVCQMFDPYVLIQASSFIENFNVVNVYDRSMILLIKGYLSEQRAEVFCIILIQGNGFLKKLCALSILFLFVKEDSLMVIRPGSGLLICIVIDLSKMFVVAQALVSFDAILAQCLFLQYIV